MYGNGSYSRCKCGLCFDGIVTICVAVVDVRYCKGKGCELLLRPSETDAGVYECGEDQNIPLSELKSCPEEECGI